MTELNFNTQETHYAKASRSSMDNVLSQNKDFLASELIDNVFGKIPIMFQILNQDRQIIYINQLLKEELETKGIKYTLGYRPGEILSCVNAFKNEGGCGTSKNCRYCGIINCVIDALKSNTLQSKEVIFESETENKNKETTNYIASAKPFFWKNNKYVILSFENVSEAKKKEQLERTFFHDLMNKVNSIYGLSEILEEDMNLQKSPFISMIKRGIFDLVDEIKFQHNLINAEKNTLVVNQIELNSIKLLTEIKEDFFPYEKNEEKKINISRQSQIIKFKSDPVLIKRCLINLTKNALESISHGDTVEIGAKRKDKYVVFWVKNKLVLSDEIKNKIFTRTFSTKGAGRGIGTYSVKLFSEKYLNGKAYFTSKQDEGTIFYLEYPLQ